MSLTVLDLLQGVGLGGFPRPRQRRLLETEWEKSSSSLQELTDEQRLRKLSTEELRFRERLTASPRPVTAAAGRVC